MKIQINNWKYKLEQSFTDKKSKMEEIPFEYETTLFDQGILF